MPKRIAYYRPPGQPRGKAEADRDYNRSRRDPFLAKLYSTARWQGFRATIRRTRVLCEDECRRSGLTTEGEIVHHKVDPRDDEGLAFDETNVLLVCRACHNKIHAKRGS